MDVITITGIGLFLLIASFGVIGFWLKNRVKSSEDFLLAGRTAPFWLLAAAYIGGSIGGASVAGYTGYGFTKGIASMWTSLFIVSGMTLFVVVFAKRLNYFGRKTAAVTIADFICSRYGEKLRIPVALSSCLRPLFLTGMQFLAIAIALKVTFDLPIVYGVPLAAISISLYMLTSGQYAALVTQWIQAILQSLSILLFSFAAFQYFGSPAQVTNAVYQELPGEFLNFWNVELSLFSIWFLTLGLFYVVDPWIYMWAYIGKSPRVACNAQLAVLGCSYFNVLPFVAGVTLATLVSVGVFLLPENLTADSIYVWFTVNHINVLVGSIIMIGLFMTILSCGSSFAMNGVTILTRDIYEKLINPSATAEQSIRASRISVIIVMVFGVLSALWLPVLVPLWILAQAICLSGLLAPTLSAWFWKRSTTKGALSSCIVGATTAVSWAMYAWFVEGTPAATPLGFHAVHVGLMCSLPTMFIVSLMTSHDSVEDVESTNFKTLGKEMRASQSKPESASLFGWLGAKSSLQKVAWLSVFVVFGLHYLLSFMFEIQIVGELMIWISLVTGLSMIAVITVFGGRDVVSLIRSFTLEEQRSNDKCENLEATALETK
ncbi:sodium:solute symporter family protein [Vibrio astriarenae]